jgi:hypothetical protein
VAGTAGCGARRGRGPWSGRPTVTPCTASTGHVLGPRRQRLRTTYRQPPPAPAPQPPGPHRTYHLKKRAEGHKHIPAVIALARRRVDVLWALLRDNRLFTTTPPPAGAATAACPGQADRMGHLTVLSAQGRACGVPHSPGSGCARSDHALPRTRPENSSNDERATEDRQDRARGVRAPSPARSSSQSVRRQSYRERSRTLAGPPGSSGRRASSRRLARGLGVQEHHRLGRHQVFPPPPSAWRTLTTFTRVAVPHLRPRCAARVGTTRWTSSVPSPSEGLTRYDHDQPGQAAAGSQSRSR